MKKDPEDITIKLGQKIVEIRQKKGIRQIDLADYVNIDDSSLRRIETGKTNPTIKTLEKIARGLEVKIKDLVDFE